MKKAILKSNLILGFQYLFGAIIPVLLMPIVLKQIGIKDFGTYSIFASWAIIGSIFTSYIFQLTGPISLQKIKSTHLKQKTIKEIFFAKLLVFIAWLALIPIILTINSYKPNQLINGLLILFFIPLSALFNTSWFLQYNNKFLTLCRLSILGAIIAFLITLTSKYYINEYIIISIFYIYPLIVGIGSFKKTTEILNIKKYSFFFRVEKKLLINSIASLKNNFNLFFSQVIAIGYGVSGPIFIGYLSGPEEAGKYSVLEKIFTPIISAGLLTLTAAFPTLINLWEINKNKFFGIITFTIQTYLILVLSLTIFYVMFQNRINQYIFGNLDNKPLFIYFLLWSFIAFSGPILTAYYSLINKPKNVLKMNVYILLFVLIVSIPLSYNYGAIGWISGLTLSHIPLLLILIVIMRNKFKT
jgi:PST family polysaccharide transporter